MIALLLLIPIFFCLGSFLNCMAYRLVHLQHPRTSRSCCPVCKQIIAWYDLVPVISWIFLRARCRRCAAPISFLYPLIKLQWNTFLVTEFFLLRLLSPFALI